MCLGVPGKIEMIMDQNGMMMGIADFSGVKREICLEGTPSVQIGMYVMVHAGFAISIMDEEEAVETICALGEIGGIEDL